MMMVSVFAGENNPNSVLFTLYSVFTQDIIISVFFTKISSLWRNCCHFYINGWVLKRIFELLLFDITVRDGCEPKSAKRWHESEETQQFEHTKQSSVPRWNFVQISHRMEQMICSTWDLRRRKKEAKVLFAFETFK